MDVFLTGASGYVGGYVVPLLVRAGHRVLALARSPAAARRATALGATVVHGDATEPGAWQQSARAADAIVHLALPSAQAQRRPYEWVTFSTRWLRAVERFEHAALPLLIACARDNPRCAALIATTGPAAAGEHGSAFVDEDQHGPRSAFGELQHWTETHTLEAARAGVAATVLRPGAVYGPDGGFGARVLRSARAGRVLCVGRGDNYLSWVHIEDYARAYLHALDGRSAGHVVAIVDDRPTTVRDALQQLSRLTSGARVRSVPRWLAHAAQGPVVSGWATQSARVSNSRARELLRWHPRFPSIAEGFPDVLRRV